MKLTLLASLIIAVTRMVTANSVGFGPGHAEATGHEELQNKVDAMNLLIAKTVTLWGNEYRLYGPEATINGWIGARTGVPIQKFSASFLTAPAT